MSAWDVYWITRASYVQGFFIAVTTILGVVVLLATMFTDGDFLRWKWGKRGLCATVLFAVLAVATPTTKEVCAIVIIPKLAKNEDVQAIGSEIVGLARDWLRELHPKESP